MKYIKKPILVEAVKLNDIDSIKDEWFLNALSSRQIIVYSGKYHENSEWYEIKTLEGTMIALPGNYIVKGIQGEIYPVKADIFEATYSKYEE